MLTLQEAGERLRIGQTTLFKLLKTKQLDSIRIGRARRIPEDALDRYVNGLLQKGGDAA